MSLKEYKGKRDFSSTGEPASPDKKKSKKRTTVFVVQKHYASHLHYDFRLELDGVLKSWAIPKGPSLDPADKHLAVMVEDHPYDYKDFSGIIPEGNYGAGKVEIWDSGTYHAMGAEDIKSSEKNIRDGIENGHITIIMDGDHLKGEFALVKLKKSKGNNWLIVKKDDDFAVRGWKIDDISIDDNIKKNLIPPVSRV